MIFMYSKGCLYIFLVEGGVWSLVVVKKINVCIVIFKLSYKFIKEIIFLVVLIVFFLIFSVVVCICCFVEVISVVVLIVEVVIVVCLFVFIWVIVVINRGNVVGKIGIWEVFLVIFIVSWV